MVEATGPVQVYLNREYPGFLTTDQAAKAVGRSAATLRRWRREDVYTPLKRIKFGNQHLWLYSEVDIQAIRGMLENLRPGRTAITR